MTDQILIVDDHPLFRAALRGALVAACEECEFVEADSVASMFDALEQRPQIDLLLLDLNLPVLSAFVRWLIYAVHDRSCRSLWFLPVTICLPYVRAWR